MGSPVAVTVETRSPEETLDLGRRIGAGCGPGAGVALVGELGAGKTRFVKGLANGLGVPENAVTSPTFVLMNLYRGRVPVAHFDLYRLERVDLASLGFYDVRESSVVVLEWADRVEERLLGDHLRIEFHITGEKARRLILRASGAASERLLQGVNLSP